MVASAQQAPAAAPRQNQTEAKVVAALLAVPKVKDWVGRYPRKSLVTQGTYDAQYADWDVKVWSGAAGEIATGRLFSGTLEKGQELYVSGTAGKNRIQNVGLFMGGEREEVDGAGLDVDTLDLNDLHVVTGEVEVEGGEC